MDALGIAVSELGSLSERRMAKLVDPAHNRGLPAFALLRETVAYMGEDRIFYKDQATAAKLITCGSLSGAVEGAIGPLESLMVFKGDL